MATVFDLLSNPLVLIIGGALVAFMLYQKFAPSLKVRVPGKGLSWDAVLAKFLGPRYAEAKLEHAVAAAKKKDGALAAGHLYEEAEQLQKAVDAYLEGQEVYAAAAVLEKMGKAERSAELFLQAGDYKKAAQLFSESGKPARAAALFEEKGNRLEAARLYGLAGQWDKAADLYDKGGFPAKAAEAYEKSGEHKKAAECYERHFMENVSYATTYSSTAASPEQKSALLAGRLYVQAGDLDRAFQILVRGSFFKAAADVAMQQRQFVKAAELYLRAEDMGRAADAYEQAGDHVKAATFRGEVALKADHVPDAARFFQEGQDYLRAAELFESVGMLAEAAGAYEAGESFAAAGSVYVRAGLKARGAASYERASDFETAAKLYEEAGDGRKAMDLYTRAGQTFKGGEAAVNAGDYERAASLLQRVPPADENYRAATELLAQTFLKLGRPQLAQERLNKALAGQPISAANLDLNYWLAVTLEQVGQAPEALALFKKILAEDLSFRDVESRVHRIETGASRSGPTPATPSGADRIGKYVLLGTLGKGAMGEVFRAHDPVLNRDVALKVITSSLAASPEHRARFRREAQSVAQLNHPNIVTVHDFDEVGDHIYMAMELLEGEDLRRLIGTPALENVDRVLSVAEQICDGLSYAHGKNVVHRDLKPGNIRVLPSGQIKILDFGLARLGASEMTQSGMVLGTPNYMSPEQVRGEHADLRSDLFSLGAVLYEMLTARRAFDAEAVPAVLNLVLTQQPQPAARLVPNLSPLVAQVVDKALAKDVAQRYQNAAEMKTALGQARHPSPATAAPSAVPPLAPAAQAAQAATPAQTPARAASGPTARFTRVEEIGRGPLGPVFRGQDQTDGKQVALRQIPAALLATSSATATLVADLKAAAQVSQPNLARVMGFVELEGHKYVIGELVPGRTFAEAIASGRRLPFPQILSLGKVLCPAIAAIHAKKLVHGSIQPSNVMVAQGIVKLVDLGLASLAKTLASATDYRAPEKQLDVAGDIYALSAVLYHLLTGTHPKSQPQFVAASKLVPGVPAAFDQLLFQNLQPTPQVRCASAEQFLQMLSRMVASA
jgi:serine/threonine protein kinase